MHSCSHMKNLIGYKKIKDILNSEYQIEVLNSTPTKKGLINHSYFIKTLKKKYVFRIYSHKTIEEILFEIRVMNIIRTHNLPVPEVLKNKSRKYTTSAILNKKKYYCILMEFMDGKTLESSYFEMIKPMAELQAQIHILIKKRVKARQGVDQVLKNWARWSKEEIEKIKPILKKYKLEEIYLEKFYKTKKDLNNQLSNLLKIPYAECHNDFFGGNILIKNKQISGIVDFDNIETVPIVFDIANTFKSWLLRNKPNKYKTILDEYLTGYQKYRKLSKKELGILPVMISARNFAVTNSLLSRKLIKGKDKLERTIEFDINWRKYLHKKPFHIYAMA